MQIWTSGSVGCVVLPTCGMATHSAREREKVKVEGQTGDTGSWGTHASGLAEAGTGAEAAAGAVAGAGAVAVVEAGAKALAQTALFRMHA